ncbi:MAG: hypothetical protein WC130_03775 [Kiritimatiellia bacterium]
MGDKIGHTPGPWEVLYNDSPMRQNQVSVRSAYDGSVANCWNGPEKPCSETLANAHLIAAAPTMLAALQHALKAINDYPDRQHPMTASEVIIREAILEAGGEI